MLFGLKYSNFGRPFSVEETLVTLVKIGAKVVSHARYVIFQMAEVLVSRSLFYEILERIHRLRPIPIESG